MDKTLMRKVGLAVLFLFLPSIIHAASWSYEASTLTWGTGYGVASKEVTYGHSVTAGSLLVGYVVWGNNALTMTCADATNGNWTPVTGSLNTTNPGQTTEWFFYAGSASATPHVTCTLSSLTATIEFGIAAYSGGSILTPTQVDNSGSGAAVSAGPASTGNFVSVGTADLVVGGSTENTGTFTLTTSGYTDRGTYNNNAEEDFFDNTSVNAGTNNLGGTLSTTAVWNTSGVAFFSQASGTPKLRATFLIR